MSSCSDGSSSTSDVVGQLKSHLTGDRKEIEELREKLNESVEEMSETESALTLSLRDLSNAGAKMDKSATDEWNSKLRQMEIQLETTTKRLELAERELKVRRHIYESKVVQI